MSRKAEFLAAALQDVADAVKFYEEQVSGLGDRFRAELESACEVLAQQPLLWRERAGGFRRVNLAGFPYYIGYFLRGERVLVAVVSHVSRHPDFWKERMPPDRRSI